MKIRLRIHAISDQFPRLTQLTPAFKFKIRPFKTNRSFIENIQKTSFAFGRGSIIIVLGRPWDRRKHVFLHGPIASRRYKLVFEIVYLSLFLIAVEVVRSLDNWIVGVLDDSNMPFFIH